MARLKMLLKVSLLAFVLAVVAKDASALGRLPGDCHPGINDNGGDAAPTPEPSSIVFLGSALAGFGAYRAARKNKK